MLANCTSCGFSNNCNYCWIDEEKIDIYSAESPADPHEKYLSNAMRSMSFIIFCVSQY